MALTKALDNAGIQVLAKKLDEAATALSHSDIHQRLSSCLEDMAAGGMYCYLVDVFGDDKSGDVVYSCGGDLKRAPYTMADSIATIDMMAAVDVVPKTTYAPEPADATESAKGRANVGDKIAKGDLVLVESASEFLETPKLKEAARTDYPVKLIAPGKGSSAYYPAEVLERDGPKVFKAGMHMYWNHPTAAEEAARPEGDLSRLAGVTTTNAYWDGNGPKGPGLYARAKVFSDHAQQVEEKGSYIGLSIRAGGNVEAGGKTKEGRPILKELTYAESTDFVTKAGAGGMVLTESAIPAKEGADDMDAAELDRKIKEAVTPLTEQLATAKADNRKLRERMAVTEAVNEGSRILAGMSLAEGVRDRVLGRCVGNVPLTETGDLDSAKFKERLEAEAKDEAAYISKVTGGAKISGMGAPAETPEPISEAKKLEESAKAMAANLGRLGLSKDAVKRVTGIDEGRAA